FGHANLLPAQGLLQLRAFTGETQQALALVVLGRLAFHQMHLDQLAQRRVQGLLADAQVAKQLLDAKLRVGRYKEQDAVMDAGKTATRVQLVRPCGECLRAENTALKEQSLVSDVF